MYAPVLTLAMLRVQSRYLMVVGDEEVKLLLEAFQMSVSACLAQPGCRVLRAQMAGRLLSVPQSASLQARAHACMHLHSAPAGVLLSQACLRHVPLHPAA
jgi:hypothetical protein